MEPNEKTIDQMTPDELRAAIMATLGEPAQAPLAPLPNGVDRTKLSEEDAAKLSESFISTTLASEPGAWTKGQRDGMRQAVARALAEMGR